MRRLTRRQRTAAVVLVAVALLFLSLDFAGGSLGTAHGGARGALGSLYRGTDGVIGPLRRFVQGIPDVGRNREQIADLQRQNAALRRQLTEADLDRSTAGQLRALQLQATGAGWTTLPARVVATGPGSGFEWTVTVDVGSRAKVTAGATVTDGRGLVGRVLRVDRSTSVVLLAADPKFGVGVRDVRSGALLLATGNASSGLSATPLADDASLKVGDQLVTGPAGESTFVAGLSVGTITSVSTSAGGSITVRVRPAAAQTGLDLLGIIVAGTGSGSRAPIGPAANATAGSGG